MPCTNYNQCKVPNILALLLGDDQEVHYLLTIIPLGNTMQTVYPPPNQSVHLHSPI